MSAINVTIYTRKDKKEEVSKVEKMKMSLEQAAQEIRRELNLEVTTNLAAAANSSVNVAQTPVVVINGNSAFAKEPPKPEKVKSILLTLGSGEQY